MRADAGTKKVPRRGQCGWSREDARGQFREASGRIDRLPSALPRPAIEPQIAWAVKSFPGDILERTPAVRRDRHDDVGRSRQQPGFLQWARREIGDDHVR